MRIMIVNFFRFQIDVGGVSTGEDPIDDGLGEGAGMMLSMTEIRSKVVIHLISPSLKICVGEFL